MLDVRRLRVLKEVAAQGSFSAAADALAYTQSAISQQIAALERETGTRLLERHPRGVRLTDAGRALVAHTEVILSRLSDAEAELDAIAGLRGGRLRLVSFPTAGSSILPAAIARFREQAPGVELSLEPREPEEGLAGLHAGDCDIAVTIRAPHTGVPDDGTVRRHLLDDPMFVCLPAGHRLAQARSLRLADLDAEPWLVGSTGSCPDTTVLLRACQTAGFEPRIGFHSDDYLAMQGFVAAGVGVALIPDLALITVRDDVVIRELSGENHHRVIEAATLDGAFCSPASQLMLDLLAEVGAGFARDRRALALAS
ncbi:MAG: LysR family transcriptional regulator [Solirubrobacteraceae bacterium]|nr:LysR family transcriptional regulator [Solirubrobacteraceae bacterium]